MTISLGELAALVAGQLHGDADIHITGASTIRDTKPGDITLADNPKYVRELDESCAAAAVVSADVLPQRIPYITVDDVQVAFAKIVSRFRPQRQRSRTGVSPAAHVSPSAKIGNDVDIHHGATIGDDVELGDGCMIHSGVQIMAGCVLGENVVVFPNAVLYEDTVVGPRCIIHAGAVIGAYGFGYKTVKGRHQLSAQLGNVEIGADVEIGAGTTIDRGTYGPTVIGEGTKIDNQVMIAHNCRIGRHNLLCSQVGISGSCTTGDYVVMAGQVGIADHLNIGNHATVAAKSGVMNHIPDGVTFLGNPARLIRQQMVKFAIFDKLPEMRKQLKTLQQKVDSLITRSQWPKKQDAA